MSLSSSSFKGSVGERSNPGIRYSYLCPLFPPEFSLQTQPFAYERDERGASGWKEAGLG